MSNINKFLMFIAISALTLNYTPSLSAQESDDSESFGIEEIIVTARKIEESSQDVPVAITAITEQLEKSNIRNRHIKIRKNKTYKNQH